MQYYYYLSKVEANQESIFFFLLMCEIISKIKVMPGSQLSFGKLSYDCCFVSYYETYFTDNNRWVYHEWWVTYVYVHNTLKIR